MKYQSIREEELKNKVGADWFKQFDTTEILGNIDFIKGKIKKEENSSDLFTEATTLTGFETLSELKELQPLQFSEEATAVFNAGRELWSYYHAHKDVNVNASLYDIREYFQGRNDKGRMNSKSDNATYTKLIAALRSTLAVLADKIKPKVYEYGFLKE